MEFLVLLIAAFMPMMILGVPTDPRYGGKCSKKYGKGKFGFTCTKNGFFQVKQCYDTYDMCHCVDPKTGNVVGSVARDQECPDCLVANAESYEMTADGVADTNIYKCDSQGFFDDEDMHCHWHACFCYTKYGKVTRIFHYEELEYLDRETFSCKQFTEESSTLSAVP